MNGPLIERRRLALGMNRTELAHAMGVSERTIYRWERGGVVVRKPNLKLLKVILRRPKKAERKVA